MKRKLLLFFVALLSAISFTFFAACEETATNSSSDIKPPETATVTGDSENVPENEEPNDGLSEISGVAFTNYSCDYDGTSKTILLSGDLPAGVSVLYENNEGTNAGTYTATATLSGEGFRTKTLTATLTINKISFDTSSVSWNYTSAFDYDGTAKTVTLTGLPAGLTVSAYSNNSATNAGAYTATATFNYDAVNYNAPVISACSWVINKATFSASLSDQSVTFDDNYHLPEYTGSLPAGTTIRYYIDDALSNGVCAIGKYAAKIVFSKANYEDLELTCTFKIKVNAAELAHAIVDAFGTVPDPWSFLPDSFAVTNHTLASAISYDDFVNVSSIPVNGIGKQLNIVYTVLNKSTVALSYVNEVYKVLNLFELAYVTFLDDDPDNYYQSFNYNKGAVSLSYQTEDTNYVINATVSGISFTIFANADGSGYGAKVYLTSSIVLKYTVSTNRLIIALNVASLSATYVEFVRDNSDRVKGYIHEATDAGDKNITLASALLEVGDDYTTIVGTKGDFVVPLYGNNRNCEVYSNSTGYLVGTEVRETLKPNSTTEYTTLWYNLYAITGITSIKKVDEQNSLNPDTIYINGNADTIHTKLYGGISAKTASRRFDIEFKTMYFYQLNGDNEYEKVECEIPMMFIQEEHIGTFESDFEDKNDVAVTLNVSNSIKSAVNYGFYTLVTEYDLIRDSITYDDIAAYCNS